MGLNLFLDFVEELFQGIRTAFSEFMESVRSFFDFLERLFGGLESTPIHIPRPVLLWGTILFVAMIILLTLRKHFSRVENSQDEEELSEGEPPDLFDLIRAGFNRALNQMKHRFDELLGLQHARRLLAAARVRRIYTNLLRLSARLDLPRPGSSTPLEFMPKLGRLFPDLLPDLEAITQAYVRVRYGELVEPQDELEKVERAWQNIKIEGERRLHPVRLR
jgi:hypothetical protein